MTAAETQNKSKSGASLRAADTTAEARREAARLMGSVTSELKAQRARENGRKAPPGPGRSQLPLSEITCTCEAGEALEGHRWNCPRGQAIKRRKKAGTL